MATGKLQPRGTGKLSPSSFTGKLTAGAKRLGDMLLEFNKITPAQLQEALEEQRHSNERLGEILVRFGLIDQAELEELLARQRGQWPVDPTIVRQHLGQVLEHAQQKKKLGEILVDFHRITPDQLEQALAEQDRTNERLGQVLVRLGLIANDELDAVLRLQTGEIPMPPGQIRERLGEILVHNRKITRAQLEEALRQQRFSRDQIGQILLAAGFITPADLDQALHIQGRMATASLVAVMAIASLSGCSGGTPAAPAQPSELNTRAAEETVAPSPAQSPDLVRDDKGNFAIKNVPFIKQGDDNTCAQAAMAMVLHYWGRNVPYQQVINESNPSNLPTPDGVISQYLTLRGLNVKEFQNGSLPYLQSLVDQGKPAIVLLDFGGLDQEHYVVVLGYNKTKKTVIFHDSIDGKFRAMNESEFMERWENANIVPLLGQNYYRLVYEIQG